MHEEFSRPAPATPPRPVSSGWRQAGPVVAGLFVTLALLLPERTVFDGYDWTRLHVFYKEYFRAALLHGGLPHWNPFIALGRPFLADIEVAAFYPPNLLYLAGAGAGVALTLWLHFTLVLAGMLRLGRALGCGEIPAWLGAAGFALGAPLLGRLQSGQLQVFCALCWLPWVFAAAGEVAAGGNRRSGARLAACLALFFLAGSPPIFWVTAWAVALFLAAHLALSRPPGTGRNVGWLAAAALLAGALVSVQALPFLELVAEGNRHGHDPAFALANNQPAQVLGSLAVPRFSRGLFYWEYNLYAGFLVLPLALLGLGRARQPGPAALWLVAIVFALLAAGAATPLLPALVDHAPGWSSFRYPSRYGIVTSFALCLLAARGLEQLSVRLAARRGTASPLATGVAAALLALNGAEAYRAHLERATLYTHAEQLPREQEVAGELRRAGLLVPGQPPPRVLAPPWLVREDSGLRFGFVTLSGFANPTLARVWNQLHARAGVVPSATDPVNLPAAMYATPLVDFGDLDLGARWDPAGEKFLIASAPPARARLEPALPGGAVTVEYYENDYVALRCTSPAAQNLVFAEPWYPGWQARIDGLPTPVGVAGGWMRSVAVPPGSHEVELVFRSRWLGLGAGLSAGGLIGLAALWFGRDRKPRPA